MRNTPVDISMLRRTIQTVAALFALYLLLSVAAGIYLAEAAIHVRRKAVTQRSEYASMVGAYSRSGVEDAAIHAPDGVLLKGWYVRPNDWNHEAVVLLHGVADNREGMAGYSVMFLKAGYAVLPISPVGGHHILTSDQSFAGETSVTG